MIIDKLAKRVEEKGPICIGLDTNYDYLPEDLKSKYDNLAEQIFNFNKIIIDATKDLVPVYKLQIAYYEAYGLEGLKAYKETLAYLRENNLISIGDIKRGDIAATADMYAKAHFTGDFKADFITVNPYMGYDTIDAYLKYIESGDHGIFVLARTSNPGSKDIQNIKEKDLTVYEKITEDLAKMAEKYIGESGYSPLGLVFGGTKRDNAIEIREKYPHLYFLIPGYGAQGAKASDILEYLDKGNGGVVNSSRGIITAFKSKEDTMEGLKKYSREATLKMKEDFLERI